MSDSSPHQSDSILVSYIIPHHGRLDLLWLTIDSIVAQADSAALVEVIVVSQDPYVDESVFESRFQSNQNLIQRHVLLKLPSGSTISKARNTGAEAARGEYLAFLDADVQLATQWQATMLALAASKPNVILFSAVQAPAIENNMLDVIRSAISGIGIGDTIEALPGANLFLSRVVFEKSSGFPEHLQTCEDSVFTHSLLEFGKIELTNKTQFIHLGEDKSLWQLFNKEIWRGKSNWLAQGKSCPPLRELPSLVIPLVVLSSALLCCLALASGAYLLAIGILAVGLLPVCAYALRLQLKTSETDIAFHKLVLFYLVYFPARGVGMLSGFFESRTGNVK